MSGDQPVPERDRQALATRLEDAGVPTDRFIDVHDEAKGSTNHDQHPPDSGRLSGNYGVYAGRGLVDVDIDDYGTDDVNAGLEAIRELPETFAIESPHTDGEKGGHYYYAVTSDRDVDEFDADDVLEDVGEKTTEAARDDPVALAIAEEFGTVNLTPSWGEVRVANQYVVGPGSQISPGGCALDWCDRCTGCDKDWCDDCAEPDGGYYRIANNAPVATIDVEQLIDALHEDPDVTPASSGGSSSTSGNTSPTETSSRTSSSDYDPAGTDPYDVIANLPKLATYLAAGPKAAGFTSSDGSGDRSNADYFACATFVEYGVAEDDARDLLEACEYSKVGTRSDDYFGRTWSKVLSDDDVTPNTKAGRISTEDVDEQLPVPSAFDVHNGGYSKFHPPRNDDGDGYYERVTNFQLEVLSRLTHDDGRREFHLRVHPADGEPYVVDVEPSSFNELRTFRRDVLEGWSVAFDGGQRELNQLKEFVAGQDAPYRRGTKQIGLHGDEFVTPKGSITADGWADEPDVVYTDESSQLIPLWNLEPDDVDAQDVDRETVAEILKLLPQTRDPERFLPVLGWFYTAPLRPLVQEWEGEFNLLSVLGDTGAGKTATLETMWRLFGMDGELLRADSTAFTILTALSSSNALPVVFDEYKPADMSSHRVDKLHHYLRTSTKGGVESKGNVDRTTDNYHLNAPVCLAGEQPIQGPAEERRTIMTTFTRDAVVGDTPQSRAFARLVGGKVGDTYHDGLDLEQHALAFYQWALKQDRDALLELWRESRERVIDLLESREFDADALDDMVLQGFQTIRFGCTLFREFASEFGVDPATTTVTPDVVDDAIAYVAGEGGGADHVSHLDRFVELLGRAASAGYLEAGQHYTVVDTGVNDTRELRVKLSTAFDQVRRYARDHDIRGEDLLDNLNDYRARIRDNAENPDGYVTTTSQNTRLDETTQTRCVGIDVAVADVTVDEFELGMFTDDVDDAGESDGTRRGESERNYPDIADLEGGYVTFEATVDDVIEPEPWHQGEGTLRDRSGPIDYVIRDGSGDVPHLEPGDRYRFEDVSVKSENGVEYIEIRPGTADVKPTTRPTGLDDHTGGGSDAEPAVTDGGDTDQDDVDEAGESDDDDPTYGELKKSAQMFVAETRGNVVDESEVYDHLVDEFGVSLERAETAAKSSQLNYREETGRFEL